MANNQNEVDQSSIRTCRVCGCTDDNCRQCIEKTGLACHWVEEDLCSACVEPAVTNTISQDIPVEAKEPVVTSTTDMKFFAQLFELIDGVDLTIKAERRAGKITLRVLPKTIDNIQPAVVTGTPDELDAGFFQAISLPIKQNKGLIIELDEMHKALQSAKRVTEAKVKIADTPAPEEKKVEPKKKVDKKVVANKAAAKKSEPVANMFD